MFNSQYVRFILFLVFLISNAAIAKLNDGLIAWWQFEGDCSDKSGAGNHGRVYGAKLTNDRFGNPESAYQFDGIDDYIDIGNQVKPPLPITVSSWVKIDDVNVSNLVFRNDRYDSSSYRNGVATLLSKHLGAYIFEGYSTASNRIGWGSNEPVVTAGSWHHFAVVFESANETRLYWDGIEVASHRDDGYGLGLQYSSSNGALGVYSSWGGNYYFHGAMDDVRVYARALSDEEVLELYEDESGKEIRIRPDKGGDIGSVSVTITGRLFQEEATVILSKDGEVDIFGDPVTIQENGRIINTTFDLTGVAHGAYDVAILNPDDTFYVIPEGFTVEEGRAPEIWVDIVGFNAIRTGRSQSYYLFYGNRGNVDAVGVPLWIAGIPSDATLNLNFDVLPPMPLGEEPVDYSQVPTFFEVDGEFVVPLLMPVIPAGFTGTLRFTLSIPNSQAFQLRAWTNPPIFGSPPTQDALDCFFAITDAIFNNQTDITDCALSVLQLSRQLLRKRIGEPVNLTWYIYNIGFQCAPEAACGMCVGGLTPSCVVCVAAIIADRGADFYSVYNTGKACANMGIHFGEILKEIFSIKSSDPNKKIGSQGKGEPNYVPLEKPLVYSIIFENLETATAPAQEVVITDQLDPNKLDLSSLSLGPISFGNKQITPSWGLNNFAADVDLRPDKNLIVHITGRLDPDTSVLTWRFSSLDPDTGEFPLDPLAGFLPPNINPPDGDGSVLFTVIPKEGLPTGTEILNNATIVFDTNPPIDTNDWINTIDNSRPESEVLSLESVQTSPEFKVQWLGTDVGAGIKDYTIYVSTDQGPFTPWITDANDTSGQFLGEAGKTYSFYSVARDQTGNLEEVPLVPDATTSVKEEELVWQGSVSSSEDDGYAFENEFQNLTFDFLKVGPSNFYPLPYYVSGMVFRDVNVPQGAQIVSARLKICSHNAHLTADVYGTITAEDSDIAVVFSIFSSVNDRPSTSASVDWNLVESWAPDTWYQSPDIAEVIQEVINREGWSQGGSLALFYSTRMRDGGYRQFSSFDRGIDFAPKLIITYIHE